MILEVTKRHKNYINKQIRQVESAYAFTANVLTPAGTRSKMNELQNDKSKTSLNSATKRANEGF